MKKLIYFVLITAFTINHIWAQATEGVRYMSAGDKNALSLQIGDLKEKDVSKLWSKYLENFDGKDKYNRKTKELFVDNAIIKSINENNTIDIYSTINDNESSCELVVWFDLGGAFLSSNEHPEKYPNATLFLQNFQRETEKFKVNKLLEAEEKKLSKLEGDKKDLIKDVENWESDIKKYEGKIVDLKEKIVKSKNDQVTKGNEIEAQKNTVEKVKQDLSKI